MEELRPALADRHAAVIWAAGFIDGEGCIHSPHRRNLNVGASQVDPRPLLRLRELFGGAIYVNDNPAKRGIRARRLSWSWVVTGRRAVKVLQELLPYLVVKQEVALLGVELGMRTQSGPRWQRTRLTASEVTERAVLSDQMRQLNHRSFGHILVQTGALN